MLKRLCQCIGIASLILVINYGDLLGGGADVRMHTPLLARPICFAQIADILLVALFSSLSSPRLRAHRLLSLGAPRARHRHPAVSHPAHPIVLPLRPHRRPRPHPARRLGRVLLLLLLRFPKWYRRLMRVGSALAASLVIFALCSIAQLLWVARWKPAPEPDHRHTGRPSPQPPRQHPLLVWIIFDELSYDQVFEHRARDLNLPNFDALRAQSTLFTNTQPVGYHTVKIIPSLLTGKPVDGIRYNFHNHLWVAPRLRMGAHQRRRHRLRRRADTRAGAPPPSAGTTPTAPSTPTPSRTATGPTTTCSTA